MELILLALFWALYGTVHSLLAANAVKQYLKQRIPLLRLNYRLLYNLFATLTLLPLLFWGYQNTGQVPSLLGLGGQIFAGLWAVAWIVPTLPHYNGRQFLGLTPEDSTEKLAFSPAHRFVRHPWYCAALPWLWLGPLDGAAIVSSGMLTAYLLIGTYLEERKLVQQFGDPYRTYQQQVPMLWPLPGYYLRRLPTT